MEGNYYCFERSENIDLNGMKIYIAGKITGLPDYKERFAAAEKYLRSLGAIVMSPAVLPAGYEQHEYLHICFQMIDVNDAIYFLENWKDSPGARSEFVHGVETHKLFLYESQMDPAWKFDNTVAALSEKAIAPSVEVMEQLESGKITINQARVELGLAPIQNGDEKLMKLD